MLRLLVLLIFIPFLTIGWIAKAQNTVQANWQQKVDYTIEVVLNDSLNTLNGKELITYHNNSPDTLGKLYLHLWTNAYRNSSTPFARQQVRAGNTKFYYAPQKERGSMSASFSVDGVLQKHKFEKEDLEIVVITLAKPILPGESKVLTSEFSVKIPSEFSRMGSGHSWFGGKDYQITQWFPKVAMYDVNGWHPLNYLDLGEFYDNFGDYKVSITVPSQYVVAATGIMRDNKAEEEWLESLSSNYARDRKIEASIRQSNGKTKTLVFEQNNVHDFAWFTSDNFIRRKSAVELKSGKIVETYFYSIENDTASMGALRNAVTFYSNEIGEYPYDACSVVEGALSAGGGMEYPMITIISYMSERVIVHEVGHNWFQGILGTDERRYPWMDEGVNSYYENLYFKNRAINKSKNGNIGKLLEDAEEGQSYFICKHQQNMNESQAPGLHSDAYTELNYGGIVYGKVALMFDYLKTDLGDSLFQRCMKDYYDRWKFGHPLPQDMQKSFEGTAGQDLSWFFEDAMNNNRVIEMRSTGPVILPHGEGIPKLERELAVTPFAFVEKPTKRYLYLLPAGGWNEHNKMMAGFSLFNEMVQSKKTRFNLTPMYSFEDKNVNGFANIETRIPNKWWKLYRTDVGIKVQAFDYTVFGDALHYTRIKPYLTFNLREGSKQKYGKVNQLELAGYYIHSSGDSADRFAINKRMHATASYLYDNNSVVHNTKLETSLEYGLDGFGIDQDRGSYVKLSVEIKQILNYNKPNKKLKARLFAGTFLYDPNGNIDGIYHFRLSNNAGVSDYLMNDLFLFRSPGVKDDFHTKQLVDNGGAMRSGLPSLIDKNWLIAVNLESTLPGKIPFRPFLDLGMGKSSKEVENVFRKELIYLGGISLVIAEDVFEVYLPLISSDYFKDLYEFQSVDLWERITFKLNIPLLNPLKSFKL